MKITDVSSESSKPESSTTTSKQNEEESGQRKRSLLEKFNVAIEEIDFDFVKKCNDAKKVERILRILRSGEEGTYPDLERCVMDRLEELNPRSRLLRLETPALKLDELGDAEKTMITQGLSEWISKISGNSSSRTKDTSIFDLKEDNSDPKVEEDILEKFPLPVRGTTAQVVTELSNKTFTPKSETKSNEKRIKSWEYDKWDKFDVDAELTKLDITDMKVEEWEKREKPKLIEEQKRIEKLMKEEDPYTSACKDKEPSKTGDSHRIQVKSPSAPVSPSPKPPPKKYHGNVEEKSYIEEINDDDDDDEEGEVIGGPNFSRTSSTQPGRSAETGKCGRRTKIIIDDIHMPF